MVTWNCSEFFDFILALSCPASRHLEQLFSCTPVRACACVHVLRGRGIAEREREEREEREREREERERRERERERERGGGGVRGEGAAVLLGWGWIGGGVNSVSALPFLARNSVGALHYLIKPQLPLHITRRPSPLSLSLSSKIAPPLRAPRLSPL